MISKCNVVTNDTKKELATHGTIQFPLACYHDDLRDTNHAQKILAMRFFF